MRFFASIFPLFLLLLSSCQPQRLNEKEVLSTFQLADGLQMELIAAEPMVADPVAMEIDEKGRMWVVEMHGYPLDVSGSGVVKLLTDTDGDGYPDQSEVFYDSLVLPTGIMRWKDGIIVTDAPDVLYLEDTDGDNKADHREVLLTGFARSNPQHNLNTPRFEFDNWIYLGHEGAIGTKRFAEEFGDEGAAIRYPGHPEAPQLPQNAGGRMLRFDPVHHRMEKLSGETQFGYTFSPSGHLINSSNYYYLFHEVIAARYLEQNPHLLVDDPTHNMPAGGPGTEVFPITKNPEHQLLTDVGVITSGCGVTWYKGGLFPEAYNRVIFTAEPVHNLVHADVIDDEGATFAAYGKWEDKEFLASTDAWFRPVNFYIGPDGALYVIDYYRQFIEHPEWMSEEMGRSENLYNGSNRGRIYRITPKGAPGMDLQRARRLGQSGMGELVGFLADPNIWWRRHAQRLLVSGQRTGALPFLQQLVSGATTPWGKIHALWTLEAMGGVQKNMLLEMLHDGHPGVRVNALRIAERHPEMLSLRDALFALAQDADPKVRYQLLCSLGMLDLKGGKEIRQQLLIQDIADPWVQTAALAGAAGEELDWYRSMVTELKDKDLANMQFVGSLSEIVARRGDRREWNELLRLATSEQNSQWRQAATLEGFVRGASADSLRRGLPVASALLVKYIDEKTYPPLRRASIELLVASGFFEQAEGKALQKQALQWALNRQLNDTFRIDAVRLVGKVGTDEEKMAMQPLIDPAEAAAVQLAALRTFGRSENPAVVGFLFEKWPSLTPELRDAAVDVLMQGRERRLRLLAAVEEGRIDPSVIGWRRTVSLLNEWDEGVRRKARNVLEGNESGRETVVATYQAALELPGDPAKGAVVFEKACSTCHQLSGKDGIAFGPDLSAVRNRTAAAIMNDILQPNQSIADGYELWEVKKTDGTLLSGVIAGEGPAAITLRDLSGAEHTIARTDIRSLKAQENSAMPNGLEQQISEQEMADLLALLRGGHLTQ